MKRSRKPPLPKGARAVMASRVEAKDNRDYAPTPPWATRALCEVVLPRLGVQPAHCDVWEPACGEGHMAEVLKEYFSRVYATDYYWYGYAAGSLDFLKQQAVFANNWIITNPPFGEKALAFALRALDHATRGVALFVQSRWYCEGIERYQKLFRDRPPTLFAPFVERVNLCMGRWEPEGSTATAYCWLVWTKDRDGNIEPKLPTFWIPPGQRKALSRLNDVARFAAWSLTQLEAAE